MLRVLRYIAAYIFLVPVIQAGDASAQTAPADDLAARLIKYCTDVPYEEMYIHTDRDIYVAGEELWFSSYLFNRHTGKLSSTGSIAYFELLNPQNVPVIQKRLLISEGVCPGSTHLPDTLTPGIYTCRIYTNWMKNFMPGNAMVKSIAIVNPFRSGTFTGKVIYGELLPADVNISFYPEGRTLVAGIPSRIAVKVLDEYQRGIPFRGTVRNSRGDSVAYINAGISGLASFELTPSSGTSYYILHSGVVTYLPMAADEGCTLSADYLGSDLVTISLTEKGASYSSDRQEYTLLVQAAGNTGYIEKFRIPGFNKTILISKRGLLQGVNQIILFNENLKPVCERYIYIDKSSPGITSTDAGEVHGRREKVTLTVETDLFSGDNPEQSRLSISVIPRAYSASTGSIKDFLDFGTEFGYLPWRNSSTSPDGQDIDNFLTGAESQWIKWDAVLAGKPVSMTYGMEQDLHYIEGIIKSRESSSAEKEKTLSMSVPGKTASFYYAHAGSDGHFNFMLPVDKVMRNLIIQPVTEEDNFSVEILSPYSAKLPRFISYRDSLPSSLSKLFSDLGARYQLNMIFGKTAKREQESSDKEEVNLKRFYGKPEVEIIMSDYIKLPVMQEVFFELTPGVRLRERKSGFEMRIVNPFTGTYYDDPPTVLIDGVIINDMSVLAGIDPEIVERIDILKTPYLTGDYIHSGIVHVITIPGKFNNVNLPDYAVRLPYRVTEPAALFISPDYTDQVSKLNRIPDFRNTLYWNPSLKPDKDGRITVEFWTSDLAGDYSIDIQGITQDGRPVSLRRTIKVN